jgi:hypothetical protein
LSVPLRRRLLAAAPWLLCALPALGQLWLLASCVARRVAYPYDLEWMEGGMLHHAARMADGSGIYVEPSVDFIPYLYTPLYPSLLALGEPIVGINYVAARAWSVLALLAIAALAWWALARRAPSDQRLAGTTATLLALGLFAATYPWVEGWYDIARADTLFLAMVVGGLVALWPWGVGGSGWRGQARTALVAAILALAFFAKQTGVLYVAAAGAIVAVTNLRRLPVYIGVAGALGLGGAHILDRASNGWFWTYVFSVHQAHDFSSDRFAEAFLAILFHFPVLPAVLAAGWLAVGRAWIATRRRPPGCAAFLIWSWVFAVSCVVGALGWATQWAHRNAYIPAMLTGSLAAGAAILALRSSLAALPGGPRRQAALPSLAAALALAGQLVWAWWSPAALVPRAADRAAGDRLIARLRAVDGDVLVPFHPWYAHLAGKRMHVHRMGIWDVSYRSGEATGAPPPPWPVRDLGEALRGAAFALILWDDRSVDPYFPGIRQHYRLDDNLPQSERPRTYTGAKVTPTQLWVPARALLPPPEARVLWSFESGSFEGWQVDGAGWGKRPAVGGKVPGQQGTVRRYGGRHFVSSMHGGDSATGTLTSPEIDLDGVRLTLRLSGGRDETRLRVELRVGDEIVHVATGENSERMRDVSWDVSAVRGLHARIVLIDQATGSWGHLQVDEIWLWAK